QSIADGAAAEDCQKEPANLVSERSGRQQEHRSRTWRRRDCGDEDRARSPAPECVLHLARAACTELSLDPRKTGLLPELVSKIRSHHRPQRSHASVVEPKIGMPCREKSSQDVE